ncbi:hypothetical protein CGMCC3_g9695 [Colletotrichum fructicola]|nr:uncharacterized protein CGMCC3_g9695 [Colletotrichum fructicola]KAE9574379.1 hypothetical protein CGMCC3_g9695 [Colletotrichum fructicola]
MSWTPTSTAGATNTIIANVSSRLCDWLSTSKRATSSRHLAECPLPYLPACLPPPALPVNLLPHIGIKTGGRLK